MTKEPLTYKLWAKICAYFLLTVCACGLLGSVIGIVMAWQVNIYAADPYRLKAAEFRSVCLSAGDDIAWMVQNGDSDFAEDQTALKNAEYRVLDHTGAELWKSQVYDSLSDSPYRYAFAYRWAAEPDGYSHMSYMRGYDLEPEHLEEGDYVVEAAVDTRFLIYDEFYWINKGIDILWALRYAVYVTGVLCLLLGAACFVFLLCGAGRRAGHLELVPGYLYKVPFDLLTAALALWCLFVVWFADEMMAAGGDVLNIFLIFAAMLCVLLPFTGWCASFAMRVKLGGWWRNTVVFQALYLLGRMTKALWRGCRAVGHGFLSFLRGLTLVWKTALGFMGISMIELFLLMASGELDNLILFWWLLEKQILFPAVIYLALTLRKLQRGGAALAAGDLNYQTDTRRMFWDFKQHGENLNSIGAGMARAVDERLKSERLKTELITNVSHDIKTPLTSIINYVDLMKRNHDPEKTGEYLEVLDRQSHKLKKLTEDLVEVSKASTGNLEVSAARHSVNELLFQAVGEYSERLAAAGIDTVLMLPDREIFAYIDGTLMWRVLDNLFSNVCKYAQSGTRFYIDTREAEGAAKLSFKNISRERLNIPADELMERFVRGDSARSGEGSGLGLNIARSLTELQGGCFALSVDGDLFKAELSFPKME